MLFTCFENLLSQRTSKLKCYHILYAKYKDWISANDKGGEGGKKKQSRVKTFSAPGKEWGLAPSQSEA
jgi:hypothetical protein